MDAAATRSPIASWLDQEPAAQPAGRGYLICGTPRSGSFFLCDLLRSTGKLGRPNEYFEPAAMRRHGAQDYPLDLPGQIAEARHRGATANGIFGAKVFASQIVRAPLASLLDGLNQPAMVYLVRRDLLGQAISFAKTASTGAFFAGQRAHREPVYDFHLIADRIEQLIEWNGAWELYFARAGITPLRLSYEETVIDPQSAVDRIAELVCPGTPVPIDRSRLDMRIQRDGMSEEWRNRFLQETGPDPEFVMPRPRRRVITAHRLRRIAGMIGLGQ